METVTIRNRDMYWDIAADIHFPPAFDPTRKYPAIISAHPIGSCKEQMALLGQRDAVGTPLKYQAPIGPLDPTDLPTDDRRGDREMLGRAPH